MFSDDFELVIVMAELNEPNAHKECISDILGDLSNEGIETSNARAEITSCGFGADALALFIFLGIGIFFAGKKIEENIDSWIRLGKRLKKAIVRLKNRNANVMLSEPMAAALSIFHIINSYPKLSHISLLSNMTYIIPNPSLNPGLIKLFKEHPYRYYVFGLGIDNEFLIIICINSYGEIIFIHKLPLDYVEFHNGAFWDSPQKP